MLKTSPPEWKIRLRLFDGRVRVGGYLGATREDMYIADELSGEIHQIDKADIDDFDVRKY